MSDIEPVDDLSQILRHRREKLDEVLERGMEPFAYNFSGTLDTIASIEMFETAEADERLDDLRAVEVRRLGRRGMPAPPPGLSVPGVSSLSTSVE